MNDKTFVKFGLIAAAIGCGAVIFVQRFQLIEGLIQQFFACLTPFYIGFAIAYILNPIFNLLEKQWRIPRGYAIGAVFILVLAGISAAAWWLIPQSISNILLVLEDVSQKMASFKVSALDNSPLVKYLNVDISYYAGKLGDLANLMFNNLSSLLVNFTTTLFNVFLGIIISIYMAIYKNPIKEQTRKLLRRLFPEESVLEIEKYGEQANEIFSHFLTGLIIDAMITGLLAYIGFSVMQVKYAATLGLIICFTNLIPYFGPLIGAIPAFISTATYDFNLALWVLVFIFILREFDANFIGPRIMKAQVGLSPLWILFFITVFGSFGGPVGLILAIPTGALLKILVEHVFQSSLLPNPVFKKRPIKSLVRFRRGSD